MEGESWFDDPAGPGSFLLWGPGGRADLAAAPTESKPVLRVVADLAADWERVSGEAPRRVSAPEKGTPALLVGTQAGNPLISAWAEEGLLDLSALEGAWEAALVARVGSTLCVVGSDPRGTVFAVYRLCEAMGVSPWHWWSRTPVFLRKEVWLAPGPRFFPGPRVQYRGLFLNDEFPNLTRWVAKNWGEAFPGVARYGKEFYAKVFELLLRLGGNTLWPAMWNNAFYEDDPLNVAAAAEFGIVMGTSHQEPMTRAQKEWDRRHKSRLGSWDWRRHRNELLEFWRQGVRARKNDEVLVTIGLRGADDTEMQQGGPEEGRAMLEEIVALQRTLIGEETGRKPAETPQVWCLYKEVLDLYRRGLRVPDDVILLWPEDNWGYLRRVPTAAERKRAGGAGIYYHFDYHGGPRSYQWVHTTPLGKVWDQMTLAARYGADRLWMVNAGHLKGYELAMEYFLRLGWNPEGPALARIGSWTEAWAAREFGKAHSPAIARMLGDYGLFNGRRKPELLAPDTYSLTDYHESERVVEEYGTLAAQAREIRERVAPEAFEAYYQCVEFPITACALVHRLYAAAGRQALYAAQGRASASFWEAETKRLFTQDLELMEEYNHRFADGAWEHFMDQPHLGYVSWNDPPANSLDALDLRSPPVPPGRLPGIFWEGGGENLALDVFRRPRRWVDLFRKGQDSFEFQTEVSRPWILVSAAKGTVDADVRLWVELDWSQVPPEGVQKESLTVRMDGREFVVPLEVFHPARPRRDEGPWFVETDGVVAVDAVHWHRCRPSGEAVWEPVAEIGLFGSGVRSRGADAPPLVPGQNSAVLEYDLYCFTPGEASLDLILAPTLNCFDGRNLSWAWSWDDEPPRIVEAVPAGFDAMHHNPDWEKTVADSVRHSRTRAEISRSGPRTLKIWMVDPGVVLYRIILDLGGLRPSYLGPPESWRSRVF